MAGFSRNGLNGIDLHAIFGKQDPERLAVGCSDRADLAHGDTGTCECDTLVKAFSAWEKSKIGSPLRLTGGNDMIERIDSVYIDGAKMENHCFHVTREIL